jgi:hypothetical protein
LDPIPALEEEGKEKMIVVLPGPHGVRPELSNQWRRICFKTGLAAVYFSL